MAQRPPHLALNPPYLCFYCFFFVVPFFVFNRKTLFFPLKRAFFVYFQCFSFFLPWPLWPPPFLFLFLCLSLALVFLSSFLSFFFAFFLFLVFVSFFIILSSLLLLHEKNNMKILNCNVFVSSIVFWGGFLSCFLFEISFSYLYFLPDLELCFLFNIIAFGFKKSWKTPIWGQQGGCNITFFFMSLCFAKCEKWSFWGRHFLPFFGCFFKKHYKSRYFSTFFKANNYKKKDIFGSYCLVQVGSYYLVQAGCVLKNANLDQIITSKCFCAQFLFHKKVLKPLYL